MVLGSQGILYLDTSQHLRAYEVLLSDFKPHQPWIGPKLEGMCCERIAWPTSVLWMNCLNVLHTMDGSHVHGHGPKKITTIIGTKTFS